MENKEARHSLAVKGDQLQAENIGDKRFYYRPKGRAALDSLESWVLARLVLFLP